MFSAAGDVKRSESNESNTLSQLERRRIHIEVTMEDYAKGLLSAVKSLPPNHRDDLLEYFNDDRLDLSQMSEFRKDLAKKLRIARCQCHPGNFALCICLCFLCLLDKTGHIDFFKAFEDQDLIWRLESIRTSLDEIYRCDQQIQQLYRENTPAAHLKAS